MEWHAAIDAVGLALDHQQRAVEHAADAFGLDHLARAGGRHRLGSAAPGAAHPGEFLHRRLLRGDGGGIGGLGMGGRRKGQRAGNGQQA